MSQDLIRYANGAQPVPYRDKAVARQAKRIHDETRLKAMEGDASLALAGHIMNGVVNLDAKRRQLAQDDPALNMLLSEIEARAVRQVQAVQESLFNGWGF